MYKYRGNKGLFPLDVEYKKAYSEYPEETYSRLALEGLADNVINNAVTAKINKMYQDKREKELKQERENQAEEESLISRCPWATRL